VLGACSQRAADPPVVASTPSAKPVAHPVSWTWQPAAPRWFVPQGLARSGDRLFISGYRWARSRADQVCHVIVLDTTDATTVAEATGLRDPSVAGSPVCHHGGGVAVSRAGLWIAGSGRLWLLDPRHPDRVRRSWAVAPGLRASTLAISADRMWIGKYSVHGRGRIGQVELRALLAPGVQALSARAGVRVAQADVRAAPNFVQGIAIDRRGLWLSRSSTRCGDLVRPDGAHRRLVPGAEGLVLVGRHRAWVLSESGARHYQRLGGRPDVPMLSFVDFRELTEGQCFRA
jgi:hypothetical protein